MMSPTPRVIDDVELAGVRTRQLRWNLLNRSARQHSGRGLLRAKLKRSGATRVAPSPCAARWRAVVAPDGRPAGAVARDAEEGVTIALQSSS